MKVRIFLLLLVGALQSLQAQSYYMSKIPLKNLDLLDDVVSEYQVFFTGENHTYADENNNIEVEMLKYLHRKAGVRNLILELGFSRGYMLDKYINNDSTYYELMRYTTSSHYLELYRALREFNQGLDSANRVRVHGVDVERFADDGPILLSKLLPKKEAPSSISFSIEVIRSYGAYSMKKYKRYVEMEAEEGALSVDDYYYEKGFFDGKTIDTMIADYQQNNMAFREYLGDGFAEFDKVFASMIEYRKYMKYANMPHQYVYRERKIYENMSTLIGANPGEKYYGQFGRCHISQTELNEECDWYAFSSIAKRLNEGVAKDRVLSIGIFYNEKKGKYYFNRDYFGDYATSEELRKYTDIDCDNTNILYRIDRKDTGLVKHYQYLIYNNVCGAKNGTRNSDFDDFHEWTTMIDLGFGFAQYDLKNLNATLPAAGPQFPSQLPFFSLGWSHNDFGFYTQSNFRSIIKQRVTAGKFKYTLGGYNVTQSFGGMPYVSRRFAFGIYGSLGFSKLTLNVQNDSLSLPVTPGFSQVNRFKYVNNGFIAGAGIDLRFALTHWLGIYARTNYIFDLSKKFWNQSVGDKNILDRNSPKTSVGYFGLNAGISFMLQE